MKKIVLIIVCACALGLGIGLPFTFNNEWLLANEVVYGLYLAEKIFFLVAITGFTVWAILGKKANGSIYILLVASVLAQGFAPLMRVSRFIGAFAIGYCSIILALSITIYLVLFCGVLWYNKKAVHYEGESTPNEIKVKKKTYKL